MTGFEDLAIAAKVRDLMNQIAEQAINRLRPDIMIGQVYRFNPNGNIAFIQLPGHDEEHLLQVQFGNDKVPHSSVEDPVDGVPDVVRIFGRPGSYFILDFIRGTPVNKRYGE